MKILYTGGTFDLFHAGHVDFLRICKEISDKVVVALNTDDFIERYKHHKPLMSYEDRKEILLSCRYVDEVISNTNGEDSKPTILQVCPRILAIGEDWAKKDYYKQMSFTPEWLQENNISLVYIAHKPGLSSTIMKQKIVSQ